MSRTGTAMAGPSGSIPLIDRPLRVAVGGMREPAVATLVEYLRTRTGNARPPVASPGAAPEHEFRAAAEASMPGNARAPRVEITGILRHGAPDLAGLDALRTADAVVLLTDADTGLTPALCQQVYLLAQLRVPRLALAVDRLGDSGFAEGRLHALARELADFAERVGVRVHATIPVDTDRSGHDSTSAAPSPGYTGPSLAEWLGTGALEHQTEEDRPFRLVVHAQAPARAQVPEPAAGSVAARTPDLPSSPQTSARHTPQPQTAIAAPGDRAACAGTVASGRLCSGARIRAQPMGRESRVTGIFGRNGPQQEARTGENVHLTLDPPLQLPDGAIVSSGEAPALVADQFETRIFWLTDEPLFPGRRYAARIGAQRAELTVTDIKYQVNPETLERLAADQLSADSIAVCNISLDRPAAFDPYTENPATGRFVILDRETDDPLGLGLLNFALRRAQNIHLQHVDLDKTARARQKAQRPCVIWFTGLSGSGKSTIANHVEQRLHLLGYHTYLLDGDNVRHGLNRDLGFTEADRVENIRRIGEVAKLMVDAGLIVLTAFISPFRSERRMARDLLAEGEFLEVFVDVPLAVAEERDPKGLYRKARRGELANFTGIDSPYEPPEAPELRIDSSQVDPGAAAQRVIDQILAHPQPGTST
ncbi:Sulfate adenylyltransferase subunit 1 / Adenylylsulfate kinase [Thioalkalivibrio nitratireducens DSM 14787]|uniref:Adenylyl-sulfate kinase n=1 Tax=Thioalkalivibrio nitratireducens (strain DSM 14787 / UNIQEM 213 / ALEN2) TaxID=1255043 RepID=L0DVB6_THIND|nr:adenylyl-sulfate kinase [Thioalkalivibrio nitratireducens]AGA32968.1 Sulfate adenylyltransferase subunit 1 / Adenylylsulfate kinase [Thioalkalivibrio nitratireducens DSM 14787]